MASFDTRPLVDKLVDELRAQVIDGRLQPGSRLRQETIAAELGVSRTPLREAFRKLQGEGWFVVHPRQGMVVSHLSIEEITDLAVARMMLEPVSAGLAAVTHDEAAEERLLALNMDDVEPDDRERIFEINREFHFEISGVGDHAPLTDIGRTIRRYWEQFTRYRLQYFRNVDHVKLSVNAHRAITEAWIGRNGEAVENLVAQHNWNAINDQIVTLYPDAEISPALRAICGRYGIDVLISQ